MEEILLAGWEENGREWRVLIMRDKMPENPRERWYNLGLIAAWHPRYALGDKDHNFTYTADPREWIKKREQEDCLWLPLYLYDHSGITIQTAPFSCPWDSGQIGYVIATPEKIEECFGFDPANLTQEQRERVEKSLRAEIAVYNQFLRGNVWMYVVESRPSTPCSECEREHEWKCEDSCCGFYGDDWRENAMADLWGSEITKHVEEAAQMPTTEN